MPPVVNISATPRPSWFAGLLLALVGLGVWSAFVLLVHPAGTDFSMFPQAVILIGGPCYAVLLAAAAIGRAAGDFLAD